MKRSPSKMTPKRRRITFSFGDQQANSVSLTGDFNQWNRTSHPMKDCGKGIWQKIMMLPPGEYEYKFVVDGQWRTDPNNPNRCPNRFGTYNNILRVSGNNR